MSLLNESTEHIFLKPKQVTTIFKRSVRYGFKQNSTNIIMSLYNNLQYPLLTLHPMPPPLLAYRGMPVYYTPAEKLPDSIHIIAFSHSKLVILIATRNITAEKTEPEIEPPHQPPVEAGKRPVKFTIILPGHLAPNDISSNPTDDGYAGK